MDYIILSYYYISSSIVHHIQFKYCKNASCKSVTLSPRSTLPAQAQMGSFLETTFKPNQSGKAPSFPPIRRHQFIMKVIFHHFKD